jgi:predicted lipoprotein with Yx(FWY)xxD motif
MLGTVERDDGTTQVTYNDLPLYYFSGDQAAGDLEGQGLNDVWWVLSPEGEPVKDKAAAGGGKGY